MREHWGKCHASGSGNKNHERVVSTWSCQTAVESPHIVENEDPLTPHGRGPTVLAPGFREVVFNEK